jgi:hypothetical protein
MFKGMFSLILFSLSLGFACSQALAADSCLDAARVEAEIFSQFHIVTEDPKIKYDNCATDNILRKFAEALLFLKDVHVGQAPADLDLGILGSNPFGFFTDRISTVIFDARTNRRCSSSVMAYVLSGDKATMHVCPYLNQFDAFTMSSTLVHEARHVEGYNHARCNHGLMAVTGSAACDPDYQDYKGSYATGTEYEIKISYSTEVSDLLRQQARSRAVVGLLERFNKLPLGMKTGALLQTDKGSVLFFDGEQATEIMRVPQDSILTTRSSLPTFFDRLNAQVQSYIFGGVFITTAGEYAESFRRKFSAQERTDLLDVSYSGDYSCLLFKDKIRCGADSDPDVEISLAGLDPVQFVSSPNSVLVPKNALNIATRDGAIYNLPVYWADLQKLPQGALPLDPDLKNVVSLGPWLANQEIAVTTDGQVMVYTPDNRSWNKAQNLPQESYLKLMAPYYWSPRLEQF